MEEVFRISAWNKALETLVWILRADRTSLQVTQVKCRRIAFCVSLTTSSAVSKKPKISGASAEKKYLLKTLRVLAIIQYGFRGYRLVSLCIRCKKNDKFKR